MSESHFQGLQGDFFGCRRRAAGVSCPVRNIQSLFHTYIIYTYRSMLTITHVQVQ